VTNGDNGDGEEEVACVKCDERGGEWSDQDDKRVTKFSP